MRTLYLALPAKIALYWVSFILLLVATGFLASMFPPLSRFIYGTGATIAAVLVTGLWLKHEKSTFRAIGLYTDSRTWLRTLYGLLLGAGLFGLIITVLVWSAGLKVVRVAEWPELLPMLTYLSIIPLALMEEIAFRSYPFVRLKSAYGLRATQIVVAVVFALYHVAGGQPWQTSFAGPGVWAFVFGLAAARTGGIALPAGIHIALNVLQTLFGMKEKNMAVWALEYGSNAAGAGERAELTGIALHMVILLTALILTEQFIRKEKVAGHATTGDKITSY